MLHRGLNCDQPPLGVVIVAFNVVRSACIDVVVCSCFRSIL